MIILKIIKENSNNIKIIDNDDYFTISLLGEDLYWFTNYDINKDGKYKDFTVLNNDYLYSLIDKLYNDIKDFKIFENNDLNGHLKNINKYNNYIPLFKDNMIDYHSDGEIYDIASTLKIFKENDNYIIRFTKGYHDFSEYFVKIAKNSRYKYFNLLFLVMYNDLNTNFDIKKTLKK